LNIVVSTLLSPSETPHPEITYCHFINVSTLLSSSETRRK